MPMRSARLALLLVLALTMPLTACAPMMAGGETRAALCDQFAPIRWGTADSDSTISQAKQHNAVGSTICGWRASR